MIFWFKQYVVLWNCFCFVLFQIFQENLVFKEEWNVHLIRRKTDLVSTPAETICSTYEDSD